MNLIGFLIFHRFYDKFLIDGILLKKLSVSGIPHIDNLHKKFNLRLCDKHGILKRICNNITETHYKSL